MKTKKTLNLLEEYNLYESMWEWLDAKGNKINLSSTQNSQQKNIPDLMEKFKKLVAHLRSMYTLQVNRLTVQILDVDIKVGTKFKNKLVAAYDYQQDCLIGRLYDESGKEVDSNNCWGGWSVLIAWLKKAGFPLISKLCEDTAIKKNCEFPFTKEDLDKALDKLTDEDAPGLNIGFNNEDNDVGLLIAGEPYSDTQWYVDKIADNLYIVTSELYGQDGGGPDDGIEKEFESIDEVWDFLSQRDQLFDIPKIQLNEFVDRKDFI